MEKNLKIAALPLDIAWTDRDENLFAAANHIHSLPKDVDVIVLPELFTCGFVTDPALLAGLADSAGSHPSLDAMRKMARAANAAVCGTVPWCLEDGSFVNRCLFVEPDGETTVYDKHHLFTLGNEAKAFTAGAKEIPVVRFRGWNIAMAVCYDLRFPEWLRNRPARYDVLLVPANWPQARAYAWRQLLIARAIENQAYVVGANRSGKDDFGTYDNLTYIFDYLGMPVEAVPVSEPMAIVATLSHTALDDARRFFPVLS